MVEVWRHRSGRAPLVYRPDYWSLVFPLGMYSVATLMLAKAVGMAFLDPIATAFAGLAAIAWGVTFFGMIRGLAHKC
jgi:tellurite resistance protein TehA-like permease